MRRRVRRLRAAHPGKSVEVWAEDEARLGLKPATRRVWWLRGRRPRSCGRTRYEWLYVYGFARPATGDTFTVIQPRVRVERMAGALAAFAAHADPDGKKVLVLDTATEKILNSFEVGDRPWGIALSPDEKLLYTANGPSNDISIVDLATGNIIKKVKVGQRPWGVLVLGS